MKKISSRRKYAIKYYGPHINPRGSLSHSLSTQFVVCRADVLSSVTTDAKLIKLWIFFTTVHRSRLQNHWPPATLTQRNATQRSGGLPMRLVSFYWRCSSRRERAILRIRDYACEPSSASDRVRFRETIEPGAIDTRLREIMSIIAPTFYPSRGFIFRKIPLQRAHRIA